MAFFQECKQIPVTSCDCIEIDLFSIAIKPWVFHGALEFLWKINTPLCFFVFSEHFEGTGGCPGLEFVKWKRSIVSVDIEIHF